MYDLDCKYIFTHPPKCAGASVAKTLGLFGGPQPHPLLSRYKKLQHAHLSAHISELNKLQLNWQDFYKFSVARNPWDRAVSRYFFEQTHTHHFNGLSFEQYIIQCYNSSIEKGHPHSHFTIKPYLFHENKYIMDHIIMQENFDHDLAIAMKNLNIENYNTYHINQKTIRPTKDYRNFYNDATKNMVTEMAKDSIEIFSYKF